MPTIDECTFADAHVVRGDEVITIRRGDMQDVLRIAPELVEHELESLHARLIGLSHLCGVDGVKGRAEFLDIALDLIVRGIGEDDERYLLRYLHEAGRHIRMRTPTGNGVVISLALSIGRLHAPAFRRAV